MTQKRRHNSEHDLPTVVKRPQPSGPESRACVPYEDVYHASIKREIVEFPPSSSKWYIFYCEEHTINFEENPYASAQRHLCHIEHRNMSKGLTVMDAFAIRVLGCDGPMVRINNDRARRWFHHIRQSPLPNSVMPSGSERPITNFVMGHFYLSHWKPTGNWHPALILPMVRISRVLGSHCTLQSLGLADNVPSCYVFNKRSGRYAWKTGYEDGGSLVSLRKYPVLVCSGGCFPYSGTPQWVCARDMKRLSEHDPNGERVAGYESALNFQRHRSLTRQIRSRWPGTAMASPTATAPATTMSAPQVSGLSAFGLAGTSIESQLPSLSFLEGTPLL